MIATTIRTLGFWLRGLWLQHARSASKRAERPAKDYSEQDEVSYETRVVAFIDILGWSKAVEDSSKSPELRRRLLNAIWALGALSKKDVEDETFDCPSYDRATQFSDSIVISFPYSGDRDLLRLIRQIASYQHSMLSSGFLLRGGITVGPLYHEGSLVFGPALNAAHALESCYAVRPRVIIEQSLNRQVERAASRLPSHWPFVVQDNDGFYSPNYLTIFATSNYMKSVIDQNIDDWLRVYKCNVSVYPKYAWLKVRWDAAKVDAGWRVEVSQHLRRSIRKAED